MRRATAIEEALTAAGSNAQLKGIEIETRGKEGGVAPLKSSNAQLKGIEIETCSPAMASLSAESSNNPELSGMKTETQLWDGVDVSPPSNNP